MMLHKKVREVSAVFKILVVEDDRDLNRSVCSFLNQSGYEATGCLNANDAYDAMYETMFDLIVSDIMMPEIDGYAFARTVRSLNAEIPILFMTARDDILSMQKSYRIGIDDYMTKPVNLDELLLRIGALLRRARIATSHRLEVGGFIMDLDEHTATLQGEEIALTIREFNILYKLLSYPKKTFSRQQLMDEFWDVDTTSSPRTVDVYMTKLRAKLADCDDFEIQTVHGLGYKAVVK
jgi:two-component system OmpR family response regulator